MKYGLRTQINYVSCACDSGFHSRIVIRQFVGSEDTTYIEKIMRKCVLKLVLRSGQRCESVGGQPSVIYPRSVFSSLVIHRVHSSLYQWTRNRIRNHVFPTRVFRRSWEKHFSSTVFAHVERLIIVEMFLYSYFRECNNVSPCTSFLTKKSRIIKIGKVVRGKDSLCEDRTSVH